MANIERSIDVDVPVRAAYHHLADTACSPPAGAAR